MVGKAAHRLAMESHLQHKNEITSHGRQPKFATSETGISNCNSNFLSRSVICHITKLKACTFYDDFSGCSVIAF